MIVGFVLQVKKKSIVWSNFPLCCQEDANGLI
jgi:hypothetical protein